MKIQVRAQRRREWKLCIVTLHCELLKNECIIYDFNKEQTGRQEMA